MAYDIHLSVANVWMTKYLGSMYLIHLVILGNNRERFWFIFDQVIIVCFAAKGCGQGPVSSKANDDKWTEYAKNP